MGYILNLYSQLEFLHLCHLDIDQPLSVFSATEIQPFLEQIGSNNAIGIILVEGVAAAP